MFVRMNSEDAKKLRKFIPLETYPRAAFEELCANITVEQVEDTTVFQRGDTLPELVYLLDGKVSLQAEGIVVDEIVADSDSAKFALAHQIPRKIDAFAKGLVRIVRLDPFVVNNPPPAEYREDDSYTIVEDTDTDADDWLNVMLRQPLFQGLPPTNLQKLLMSLKTIQVEEGDVIIEAGAQVEAFYVINKGQCLKSRSGATAGIERKLLVGDSFGDDNLLLDIPARERVSALSDATLIQLEKTKFFSIIATPLLRVITDQEMSVLVSDGVLLLDVRAKQQAEKAPLGSGINIPYLNLLAKIDELDQGRPIITYADEKTSQAAAFLLLKHNFQVFVVSDGTVSVEPEPQNEVVVQSTQDALLDANNLLFYEDSLSPPAERDFKQDYDEVVPVKPLNVEAELKFLRVENQRLTAYVQYLEKKNTKLTLEKQQIALRYQAMGEQLNKLKEFLARYKKK